MENQTAIQQVEFNIDGIEREIDREENRPYLDLSLLFSLYKDLKLECQKLEALLQGSEV